MMFDPLYALLGAPSKQETPTPAPPSVVGRPVLLAMLFVIFVLGFYLAVKPRGIVWLSKMMMPNRIFPDDDGPPSGYVVVRLIGACFVAFAIYSLALILKD